MNSEAMKAAQLRHYRRNREDILAALKKYYRKHLPYTRIESRKQVKRWVKKNRKKWNNYIKTRRKLIRNNFWQPYSKVYKYKLA